MMNKNINWMSTALMAGAGALSIAGLAGMAGMMSLQKSNRSCHCHDHGRQQVMGKSGGSKMMTGMTHRMAEMGDDFADELCMMAHKTGNAMIRTGRMINRMVP